MKTTLSPNEVFDKVMLARYNNNRVELFTAGIGSFEEYKAKYKKIKDAIGRSEEKECK